MEERRQYVRIPESSTISYKCVPQEKIADYMTMDLSQGGLRFKVHEFVPKGSYLKIRLKLANTLIAFEAMVKLVWCSKISGSNEYEIGVQFVDIPPHAVQHLMGYIRDFLNKK